MSKEKNAASGLPVTLLVTLCSAYALTLFLRICITGLADGIEASMNITATQVSLLGAVVMAGYGLMQIPAGICTDAIGGRKTIMIFLTAAGLGTLLVASTSFFPVAVAGRFITGLAIAMFPAFTVTMAKRVPPERFAQAMSTLIGCGAVGVICGGTPLALLNKAIGWRGVLFLSAGLAFGLAVLVGIMFREEKDELPRVKTDFGQILANLKYVFTSRDFWPLAVCQMCIPGTFFILASAWWAKYLMATGKITHTEFGHVFALQAMAGVFLIPILGSLSDKLKTRKKFLMGAAIGGVFVGMSHVFLAGKIGYPGIIIQATLFGLTAGAASGPFQASIKETFPGHLVGTAVGCANILYPVYAALMTPLFGKLMEYKFAALSGTPGVTAEAAGSGAYAFACWLLVAGFAVGLVSSFFVKESYKGPLAHGH